jgi:hypothetical protein
MKKINFLLVVFVMIFAFACKEKVIEQKKEAPPPPPPPPVDLTVSLPEAYITGKAFVLDGVNYELKKVEPSVVLANADGTFQLEKRGSWYYLGELQQYVSEYPLTVFYTFKRDNGKTGIDAVDLAEIQGWKADKKWKQKYYITDLTYIVKDQAGNFLLYDAERKFMK